MKNIVFLAIAICLITKADGQESRFTTQPWLVRANVQHGVLLPEYGFMSYLTDDYVRGFEVNFCKQTSGKNVWQQIYRYPAFGMSFHFTTLGSKEYFGDQYSLYPYYALNIVRRKRFEFNYQMGLGISYATKKYSQDQNYQNLAIGSHFNIHYHADLLIQYRFYNNLSVNSGIVFSHISNANLSEPNVGLNLCAFSLGVGYSFGKPDTAVATFDRHLDPFFTYELMIAGGMKHTRTFESFQYPAVSISFDVKRRFGYKFALGIGADFFYDSSVEPQMLRLEKPYSPSNSFMSGIHLAEEFVYNKFSLIVQEGLYIGLTEKLVGYKMYNRAIVRYKFSPHFFANFSLKSHLYILDFPEIGFGYYW